MYKKVAMQAIACALGLALSQAATAADIKLGAAAALTGPAAKYGVSIRNGFQLAVDEVNAAKALGANRLLLAVEDEQGKKEEAITVFKKLIFQDKVIMVLGPTLSSSAFAADPIANASRTPVLGTSNTADGITAMGPFVFRN